MKPIVNSLLDLDDYKMKMLNVAYIKGHSNVPVKYVFTNRIKSVDLGNWIKISELEDQIAYVRNLEFADNELKWLLSLGYSFGFVNFLRENIKLVQPNIIVKNDRFHGIEIEGAWKDTILWETILLSIVNQLFNKSYGKHFEAKLDLFDDDMVLKGVSNLEQKIELLKEYPDISISEFGTRRRFSNKWQEYVIKRLYQEIGRAHV